MIQIETNPWNGTILSCVINKYLQSVGGHWFARVKNQICYLLAVKQNQFVLLGIVATINIGIEKGKIKKRPRPDTEEVMNGMTTGEFCLLIHTITKMSW